MNIMEVLWCKNDVFGGCAVVEWSESSFQVVAVIR